MADVFTADKRSQIMSRVRGYDTFPELAVRSLLHRMGYRFRVHQDRLPGNPDIVLHKYKKVIFINGCFWHGHKGCTRSKRPTSNVFFWTKKLEGNIQRDRRKLRELKRLGWNYLIIWQCQIKDKDRLKSRIRRFMLPGEG